MDIKDIQEKIENGGATSRGKLSAEEFNTVLLQVIENMDNGTEIEKTVNNNYKELSDNISSVQRTIDGGAAATKYGGVRQFDCGGA